MSTTQPHDAVWPLTPDVARPLADGGSAAGTRRRIPSLDIIRGVVMVLMAIDHVRVFSGLPSGGPTPGIFFTRWVTNFCAPAFFFLAGTGAYLYGQKLGGEAARGKLARFLVTRGAWLILMELTVLRFAWTFNFDYAHYTLGGVIWAIGWCMILLAGLVFLPTRAIAAIGIAIIAGHNLMDAHLGQLVPAMLESGLSGFWKVLYLGFMGGPIQIAGTQFTVLYSIVPWIGVMAAGYAFGAIMRMDAAERRRWCFVIGGAAIALFVVLRGLDLYGDPGKWNTPPRPPAAPPASAPAASAPASAPAPAAPGAPAPAAGAQRTPPSPQRVVNRPRAPGLLRFLNTNKYPASFLFLLMTLGPTIMLIPLLEHARGPISRVLTVYGRVPFFYYMLHIPLIHLSAVVVSRTRDGQVNPWLFANHPMGNPGPPDGYTWGLPLLYLVTIIVVALLYFPCRWLAGVKERRSDIWWLRYL